MAKASKAIPTPRVYSLLKAANPGQPKSDKADAGKRVNSDSKRTFDATIAAAKQAKSAQEFAKLLGVAASETVAATSCGAITELTVEYPPDGTIRIHIAWENCPGHTTIYAGYDR
ncbi:MAG TPA: hypothetical protein VHU19_07775 [Pyrinomonadaceae bacterium]|jgi:hypothetical protein|nr:hypothetical protein [Pyrinomonadaceae bacterium]